MDQASQATTDEAVIKEIFETRSPELEKLIALYEQGLSYADIGAAMGGWTRGQVSGKLWRAGALKRRANQSRGGPKKKKERTPKPTLVYMRPPLPPEPKSETESTPRRIRVRLIDTDTEVTLMELEPHHCRFPLGDPKRPDFRFCGCRRVETKPYCPAHIAITVQPPYSRR
jgi:GcrA cell cycle regulator